MDREENQQENDEFKTGRFSLISFRYGQTMDGWIMRRLRALLWRQWKHARKRYGELRKWGVPKGYARVVFRRQGGSWAMSQSRAMTTAFSPAKWRELGLIALNVS